MNGIWRCLSRAVDQHDQVIDIAFCSRRDISSAQGFFTTSLTGQRTPTEVITARASAVANVIEGLIPAAFRGSGQRESNRCEGDHGRLTARRGPIRGLTTDRTTSIVIGGHAFVQHLRRVHDALRVGTTFAHATRQCPELAPVMRRLRCLSVRSIVLQRQRRSRLLIIADQNLRTMIFTTHDHVVHQKSSRCLLRQ